MICKQYILYRIVSSKAIFPQCIFFGCRALKCNLTYRNIWCGYDVYYILTKWSHTLLIVYVKCSELFINTQTHRCQHDGIMLSTPFTKTDIKMSGLTFLFFKCVWCSPPHIKTVIALWNMTYSSLSALITPLMRKIIMLSCSQNILYCSIWS